MKTRIQQLKHIVALAEERHAPHDAVLREAIDELREIEKREDDMRAAMLEARGAECFECGKKYLPLPGDFGFCSVGCRLGESE